MDLATAEGLLRRTPYLVQASQLSLFGRDLERGAEIANAAQNVGDRIQRDASEVFDSFGLVLRSELISESNRIEGIDWSSDQVKQVVLDYREILSLPVHAFVSSLISDEKVYEVLGLYRAQLLAEEWARSQVRPREHEIRELHSLITSGADYAGRYKRGFNRISGSNHVPPAPADAAVEMGKLASWLAQSTGSPILDATVVHAWLAHIHPFDDGNGRMSRLLANLALTQASYPPLIIRADSDRGEYYDALEASDDGDILPLFELFTRTLRRTTKVMGRPGYAESVIRDRMLITPDQRESVWRRTLTRFEEELTAAAGKAGLRIVVQGRLSSAQFIELADGSKDGNGWYVTIGTSPHQSEWLLWFGFNSRDYLDVYGSTRTYPSIFLSRRDERTGTIHPFEPISNPDVPGPWDEVVLRPATANPVAVRVGPRWDEYTLKQAAERLVNLLGPSS